MKDSAFQRVFGRIPRFLRLTRLSPQLLELTKRIVRDHVDELRGGVCDCPRCQEACSLVAIVEGGTDESTN